MNEKAHSALKKQIHYVGFMPRLMATLIDVVVISTVFYPVFTAIAWLTFGDSDPAGSLGAIVAPDLQGAKSFSEVISIIRNNQEFWQQIEEQKILVKVVLQYALQLVSLLLFIWGFWVYNAATPGKMLLSMRIADAETFEKPTKRQFTIRVFSYFISFFVCLLGFLWIGANKRKRGWHDKMAGTVVIKS